MRKTLHNPLITVVIATYNGEKFLRKQLDSIFNQTYSHLEIIAIDDCSTDSTVNILNEYAGRHDNFTVVSNDRNIGYIKNFEKGFLLANGNFIAPSDQDDIWLPNKIEVLLNSMSHHDIVYCNSAFIDSEDMLMGDKLSDIKTLADFNNPLMYIVGASAPSHAMLLTKSVAIKAMPFPELFSHDNWLGFVATFDSSVKFVNEVLVHYRRHYTNVFSTVHKKKKVKETVQLRIAKAQQRLQTLYDKCPDYLPEKDAILQICKSYENYSITNNFLRMRLFFQYRDKILLHKKYRHTGLRRWLHCVKRFYKMI